jgi:hypothetical protein
MQVDIRKIRLIEGNAKCSHLKLTRKGRLIWVISDVKKVHHVLNNYKDTKTKFRVSKSLWTRDRVSHVRIFDPALWTIAPLTLSLVHLSHPSPPSQSQRTVYTDSVWLGGGGRCWVVLGTIFCRSLTLCFWPDSEPTKLLHHPKKNLEGKGTLDR